VAEFRRGVRNAALVDVQQHPPERQLPQLQAYHRVACDVKDWEVLNVLTILMFGWGETDGHEGEEIVPVPAAESESDLPAATEKRGEGTSRPVPSGIRTT